MARRWHLGCRRRALLSMPIAPADLTGGGRWPQRSWPDGQHHQGTTSLSFLRWQNRAPRNKVNVGGSGLRIEMRKPKPMVVEFVCGRPDKCMCLISLNTRTRWERTGHLLRANTCWTSLYNRKSSNLSPLTTGRAKALCPEQRMGGGSLQFSGSQPRRGGGEWWPGVQRGL